MTLRTIIIDYKAIVSRLVGNLAAGHVFDLGFMGGTSCLAQGERRKGYSSVTGIPLPKLEQ